MNSHALAKRTGIISLGNLLVDITSICDKFPKESMLANIEQTDHSCGGGCANVLFDIRAMDKNIPLSISGAIGNDENGNYILSKCIEHNIDTNNIQKLKGATSYTNVYVDKNTGKRTFFYNKGLNKEVGYDTFSNIKTNAKIAHLAYLMLLPKLEDEDHEYINKGARLLHDLQNQGYITCVDLVSVEDNIRYKKVVEPCLKYIDYLIINDEEASRLIGSDSTNIDFNLACKKIYDLGCKNICIHFPNGAIGYDGKKHYLANSYKVPESDVISTLGAGDAFCAGFIYAIHENKALDFALKLGCASAHFNLFSITATDGAVSYEKMLKLIEDQ